MKKDIISFKTGAVDVLQLNHVSFIVRKNAPKT